MEVARFGTETLWVVNPEGGFMVIRIIDVTLKTAFKFLRNYKQYVIC